MTKMIRAFILILLLGTPTLVTANPLVFPVPFVSNRDSVIHFSNLPSAGSIKIYSISGERVVTISIPQGALTVDWNVTNDTGQSVASGVYLYLIDGDGAQSEGKLVVIR
jgi:hypothetical protein